VTCSRDIPAELVCRLEEHAVDAWPATVTSRTADGWVLRATPGLDQGRSNHALTPCRELGAAEVPKAIASVEAFARLDDAAVGIAVDHDDLVGLFCLAVDPTRRRSGLGTALVRALLAGAAASTAYLQVEEDNAPAVALYERLGFSEAYRYCHRVAPG
jgi:ribosomal protein S18 acetylase RimI-like enzyme